jgi:hypothetical protein
MAILTDLKQPLKWGEKIKCICDECNKNFEIRGAYRKRILSPVTTQGRVQGKFCSKKCMGQNKIKKVSIPCKECGEIIYRTPYELKKVKNAFCGHICSGKYNAKNKTTGGNRSKLEIWLEGQLKVIYPILEFRFNDTKAIEAELDIYIPALSLAFELNGIFHYENIFGKLQKTQERDKMKVSLCYEKHIGLCVIDTSNLKYFKNENALRYLKIITDIIDQRIKEVREV